MSNATEGLSDSSKKKDKPINLCPNCGGNMEKGTLQSPGSGPTQVFIEITVEGEEFPELVPLTTWACRECGKVSLHAHFSK